MQYHVVVTETNRLAIMSAEMVSEMQRPRVEWPSSYANHERCDHISTAFPQGVEAETWLEGIAGLRLLYPQLPKRDGLI